MRYLIFGQFCVSPVFFCTESRPGMVAELPISNSLRGEEKNKNILQSIKKNTLLHLKKENT